MSSKTGTSRVADRYALALYELAESQGALDAVASDFSDLNAMLAESPDLRRALESPVLARAQQGKALEALADKAGFSKLTRNFLGMISLHRRVDILDAMIEAFQVRLSAARGEVTAHVSTATPLSEEQVGALEAALKKELGNDNVTLVTKVDPSVLGGMVVRVGSRMIDSSLRTKLKRLHFAMKGVG